MSSKRIKKKWTRVQRIETKDIDTISQLVATVFRVLTGEKFHVFENTQSSLQRLNENGASLFILRPLIKKLDPAFLKLVIEKKFRY